MIFYFSYIFFSFLGIIVIDEVHLVGERSRGFLLELLCTKALQFSHIQIIGMSATVPNLEQLGKFGFKI